MTPTDLKLYELLGDKTLSFGCLIKREGRFETYLWIQGWSYYYVQPSDSEYVRWEKSEFEIIGHEPTIADLHRLMNDDEELVWEQDNAEIRFDMDESGLYKNFIPYDSSKSLLSQSEETKLAIIKLIESYARD